MNIRFAVVAAASTLATLPGWAQGVQVGAATNISISGLLAVGVKNSEVTNTVRPGMAAETHVDDNTSRLIISSVSKITDGWNVIFRVESRFTADTRPGDVVVAGTAIPVANASGWADGDTWGGVSTPIGSFVVGKSTLYYADTISVGYLAPSLDAPGESYRIWDANGLGTFNLLDQVPLITKTNAIGSTFTLGNTRSRNVARFDSKAMSGFDFSLAWSKNAAGSENWYPGNTPGVIGATTYTDSYNSGATTYARVRYNGNGVSFSGSYLSQKVNGESYTTAAYTGPLDLTAYRLGISYMLPFKLKVGLVYDNTSIDNGVSGGLAIGASQGAAKRSVFMVPISYSWGDHAAYLTYTKAGDVSSATASGAKQLNVGYDYALTKRAFVGFFYTKLDNDTNGHYTAFLTNYSFGGSAANTAGFNGEGFRQFGINLNYWF